MKCNNFSQIGDPSFGLSGGLCMVLVLVVLGCGSENGGVIAKGVPPPAQGGVRVNVAPSMDPTGACSIGAHTVGIGGGGDFPNHQAGNPGKRVIDGQDGANVSCRVSGVSDFGFAGTVVKDVVSFSATGRVSSGSGGSGIIALGSPQTAQHAFGPTSNDPDCTFAVLPAPLQVEVGRLWATFQCAAVRDPVNYDIVCSASGEIVFENCEH